MKFLSTIIIYFITNSLILWGVYKLLNITNIPSLIFWVLPTIISISLFYFLHFLKENQFLTYLFFILGNTLSFNYLLVPTYIFCDEERNVHLVFRLIIFITNLIFIFLYYNRFIRKKNLPYYSKLTIYLLILFFQLNSYFYEYSIFFVYDYVYYNVS